MTPADERDAQLEPILRRHLRAEMSAEVCPDAETLAAWADDGLDGRARASVEDHMAGCARCQAVIATLVQSDPPVPSAGVAVEPDRAPWWRALLRPQWMVPAMAATALLVWAVVPQESLTRPAAGPAVAMKEADAPPREESAGGAARQADSVPATPAAAPPATPAAPTVAPSAARPPAVAGNPSAAPRAGAGVAAPAQAPAEGQQARERTAEFAPVPAGQTAAAPTEPSAQQERFASTESRDARSNAAVPATPPPPAGATPDLRRDDVAREASAASASAPAKPAADALADARQSAPVPVRAKAVAAPLVIRAADGAGLWRVTGAGQVERSTDGGASWNAQALGRTVTPVAGAAPSARVCWLVGPGGVVLRTTDGDSWTTINPPPAAATADFIAIEASDAVTATVRTADGRAFRTTDGGATWRPAP